MAENIRRQKIAANAERIRELATQLTDSMDTFSTTGVSSAAVTAIRHMSVLTFIIQETLELLIEEAEQAQEHIEHNLSFLQIVLKEEPHANDEEGEG